MPISLLDRQTLPEATGLPGQLSFKTAETATDLVEQTVSVDEAKGIVTAIVSVTGIKDEVDDIIVPGAYTETLSKRRPKVCWAHSWEHPIGKVLYIEELLPGDKRLPTKTRDGAPWPKDAGALVATMQFNLRTDEGRNAFEVVKFYSDSGECEYSIGYNVPPGKSSSRGGIRYIKMLELYELSVVLFGAHTMTGTLSIKSAFAAMQAKRALPTPSRGGVDLRALMQVKAKRSGLPKTQTCEFCSEKADRRVIWADGRAYIPTCADHEAKARTVIETDNNDEVVRVDAIEEGKAAVPPQFRKDEDDEDGDKPTPVKPQVTERDDLPQHDADTNLTATCPGCDEMVVFDTANGWQRLDGSYSHDDGTTHSDWLLPPDAAEAEGDDPEAADDQKPDEDAEPSEGGPGPDARPPVTGQVDDDEHPQQPDHSDGIMVAVFPDPAAADAVAAHIAGPDDTTPREDLHVTLAYLGKVGEAQMSEQAIIDAVTRAVEGQPVLSGEIGGIGQFPAGEDGAPTYAPVDVPGLSLLREQIVAELGEAVYTDHGFTPHMTLGYNIGIIDPVPPVPVTFGEVRVVYGNSERGITLGAPVAEAKGGRTLFTETEPPTEATEGDYWFKTSEALMHKREDDEWKVVSAMSAPVASEPQNESKAAAYDPMVERIAPVLPGISEALVAAMEGKAGGADRNRGDAEQLRRYWTVGEGGLKIAWDTPGDFTRCVKFLSEHMTPERAKGYCANRHKEMTGVWPGDKANKDAGSETDHKVAEPALPQGKTYPQLEGSFEERQQVIREALYDQYADHVDEHGRRTVWIDVRSTFPDQVLYGVSDETGVPGGETDYFLASYRVEEDGTVEFGEPEAVDLRIVPVLAEGESEDDVALGDALPLVEDVMDVAHAFKVAARSAEGKAGRVLSGANERALVTALEHLFAVLSSAGITIDSDTAPEVARAMGNTGSRGDVRREPDPAVDFETTSPAAVTKSDPAATEEKGLAGGEMVSIDFDERDELLASIEAITADD